MFNYNISVIPDIDLCEKKKKEAELKANDEYNKQIKKEIEIGLFNKYCAELPNDDDNFRKWLSYAVLVEKIVDDIAIKSGELKECGNG